MTVLPPKLPIGTLLKNAGLITDQQLLKALEVQKLYSQMKLGEVLVLQEGIRTKTIDFFVEQWYDLVAQGQQFPLGYYLNQACLLNDQQVANILHEQEQNQRKFGEIAVRFGWVKQTTIDFFLNNLSESVPQQMSLNFLEEYNQSTLHLERKYADHTLILSRILAWTGGNYALSKMIGEVLATSDTNIPAGFEAKAVDQLVENSLIRKWQTTPEASYIRDINQALVNNCRCTPNILLREYREILIKGGKEYTSSQEQNELLSLGLILRSKQLVRVSNIIYQQIFNQDYISQALHKIAPPKDNSFNSSLPAIFDQDVTVSESNKIDQPQTQIVPHTPQPLKEKLEERVVPNNTLAPLNSELEEFSVSATPIAEKTTEPIARISAVVTLAMIALFIPLFATINSYYSSRSSSGELSQSDGSQSTELQELCGVLDVEELNISLNQIFQLEQSQRKLNADFPSNCENKLNHLRVIVAPQLGKNNRTTEAIRHLCKVPFSSDVFIDAEVWLKRWYDSPTWGKETKFYIQEQKRYSESSCPAAGFLEGYRN